MKSKFFFVLIIFSVTLSARAEDEFPFRHKISQSCGKHRFEIIIPSMVNTVDSTYSKLLRIYSDSTLLFHTTIQGTEKHEWQRYTDSLELEDFNSDGFCDIRIYNSIEGRKHLYYLYNPGIRNFYYDSFFSNAINTYYNKNSRTLTGRLSSLYADSAFQYSQEILNCNWQEGPQWTNIQYHYVYGKKVWLQSNFFDSKKRYRIDSADFNFDGNTDFRIKGEGDLWLMYIYKPENKSFEMDSILSSLIQVPFEPLKKTLIGSKSTKIDDLTTRYDRYEIINCKTVLTEQWICKHVFPHSERIDCTHYKLIDGEMKFFEFRRGDE